MFRALLFSILFILVFTVSRLAAAYDVDLTRYTLPTVPTRVLEGTPYKCLDTEQWKTVLIIAREYQGLYDWRLITLSTLNAHKEIVFSYETTIGQYQAIITEKDNYIKYLKLRLDDTEKSLALTRFKGDAETYVLWAVVAVETILMVGLGTYTYVETYGR